MGAFNGSLSFKKFYVDGVPPDEFREKFQKSINQSGFRNVDPASGIERAIGWCKSGDPLCVKLDVQDFFWSDYIVLSLRIDTMKIPSSTLNAYIKQAEREYLKSNNKEELSASERRNIKKITTAELRGRVLPVIKTIDVVWSIHEKVVRFWTQSEKTCEEFSDLFEKTFSNRLVPETPYTKAKQCVDDAQSKFLDRLEPSAFSTSKFAEQVMYAGEGVAGQKGKHSTAEAGDSPEANSEDLVDSENQHVLEEELATVSA